MKNIILILAIAFSPICTGCSDIFYPKTVSGTVVNTPNGRLRMSEDDKGERFGLKLIDWSSDNQEVVGRVAGSGKNGKTILVDCLSTRCASLTKGDKVTLDCKHDIRWFEPNVIECKLDVIH